MLSTFNIFAGGKKYGLGMDSFTFMMVFNSTVLFCATFELFLRITKLLDKLVFEFKSALFWNVLYICGFSALLTTHIMMLIQFKTYDGLVTSIAIFGLINCIGFLFFIIQNSFILILNGTVNLLFCHVYFSRILKSQVFIYFKVFI